MTNNKFCKCSGEKGVDPFVCSCLFGVVFVAIVLTFLKKLLGYRNGHRPGSLWKKWNPESGSQTHNHTFIWFIHPPWRPARDAGRRRRRRLKYVCEEIHMSKTESDRKFREKWLDVSIACLRTSPRLFTGGWTHGQRSELGSTSTGLSCVKEVLEPLSGTGMW